MSSVLDRLDAMLAGLGPDQTAALDKVLQAELKRPWLPTPGPQLEAFLSPADLLLFGGAAGGGKTDLICGLALTEHERAVIFRRQANDLEGFWERLLQLCPVPKHKDSNKKKLTTTDRRLIECGHLDAPGSERGWQGRGHDLIAFDEGAQLTAFKVKFVMGWLRSSTPGQRCRAVIASNPPIGGDGAWLMEWFAPWLDPMFPHPANPGELRWGVAVGDGDEIRTQWVDGPSPVIIEGANYRLATASEITDKSREDVIAPLSRSFVPSRLDDNPFLRDTNYRSQLQSMPEPLRSQLLHGDFLAGREDDEWQVIPSSWVRAAQERWKGPPRTEMKAIGADIAQGGIDKTSISRLHEPAHFAEIETRAGVETPDGPSVADLVLKLRRDNAVIGLDTTGGWGGSARDHLKTHHQITAVPIVFSAAGNGKDPATGLEYHNLRAQMYWQFRTALDPDNGEDVVLPPGARIVAQLTAAHWKPRTGKILIESKEDIRERLGSSPDDADAIVMAWFLRNRKVRAASKADLPRASLGAGYGRPTSWMR